MNRLWLLQFFCAPGTRVFSPPFCPSLTAYSPLAFLEEAIGPRLLDYTPIGVHLRSPFLRGRKLVRKFESRDWQIAVCHSGSDKLFIPPASHRLNVLGTFFSNLFVQSHFSVHSFSTMRSLIVLFWTSRRAGASLAVHGTRSTRIRVYKKYANKFVLMALNISDA